MIFYIYRVYSFFFPVSFFCLHYFASECNLRNFPEVSMVLILQIFCADVFSHELDFEDSWLIDIFPFSSSMVFQFLLVKQIDP